MFYEQYPASWIHRVHEGGSNFKENSITLKKINGKFFEFLFIEVISILSKSLSNLTKFKMAIEVIFKWKSKHKFSYGFYTVLHYFSQIVDQIYLPILN